MAFNFLKKRWQKILLIVLASVAFAIFILNLIVDAYWSPILSDIIKKVVAKSSEGLYQISFSDSKLDVLQGKIVIYNLVLKVDSAVYHQKQLQHLAPNNLYELHIKRLAVSHIHPFRLYFKHQLDIGEVILSQPELRISYELNHTKDTTTKDNRTIYQRISKSLQMIHVGNILFNDVKFQYADYSGHKVARSEFKEMDLNAKDLLIDSATQTDKSRLFFCKDLITELYNYSGKTSSGLYAYRLKYFRLSTRDARVDIKGFDLQPVKATVFFDKSLEDRFTLHLDSVQLKHFDFLAYHKYRIFNARDLSVQGGIFNVFGNPHSVTKHSDRVVTFPHVGLQHLKAALNLDTLNLARVNVTYIEYNTDSKKTGYVEFFNTAGRFVNITNNPDSLKKRNLCVANLTSHFMNRGKMDVRFTFNLTDPKNAYSYKGHLGGMDIQPLNKATVSLALIKINSGNIKSFDFDIQADRFASRGHVSLLYNNLKITLLKADTANRQLKKKTLESIFANLLIIKHDNPDNGATPPRSFHVNFQRPPEYPFFKNIWNTLLRGIKPCVGIGEKTEQEVKTQMTERNVKKQERLAKRAERKQRRQERRAARELKKQQKEAARNKPTS
jgi:hypothetical protein